MQEVYRISVTHAHKPWRDYTFLIDNKEVFDYFSEHKNCLFSEIPNPIKLVQYNEELEEDDSESANDYLDENSVSVAYPYVLLGELTFYTE